MAFSSQLEDKTVYKAQEHEYKGGESQCTLLIKNKYFLGLVYRHGT